jgi:hypothetical protein
MLGGRATSAAALSPAFMVSGEMVSAEFGLGALLGAPPAIDDFRRL